MTRQVRTWFLVFAGLGLGGVSAPAVQGQTLTPFRVSKNEGVFSHDVYLHYDGDVRLEEVKLSVVIFYEKGSTRTLERFYGIWNTGVRKTINFPNNSEGTIQRVQVTGSCFEPGGKSRSISGSFLFAGP